MTTTTTIEDCHIVAAVRRVKMEIWIMARDEHLIGRTQCLSIEFHSHVIESKIIDVVVLSVEYFACNYANSICVQRDILSYNFIKTSNNAVKYFVGLCCCDC